MPLCSVEKNALDAPEPNFVFPCLRISAKLSSSMVSLPFDSDFFFDFFLLVEADGTGMLLESKLEVTPETSVCWVDLTVGSAFASRNNPGVGEGSNGSTNFYTQVQQIDASRICKFSRVALSSTHSFSSCRA